MYFTTSDGNVWSCKTNRYIKPSDNGSGYLRVTLRIDGKSVDKYIHRLVAEAFVPNQNGYLEVNHIDGNKRNNHYTNLEWCSSSQNTIHALKAGLKPVYRVYQYGLDSRLIAEWDSANFAGMTLGINPKSIRRCCAGLRKSYKKFIWEYV